MYERGEAVSGEIVRKYQGLNGKLIAYSLMYEFTTIGGETKQGNLAVRRPVFSVLQTNTKAANNAKLRIKGNQGKFITRPLGSLGSGRKRAVGCRFRRVEQADRRDLHTGGNVI